MDFYRGDKVIYKFPEAAQDKREIIGNIEFSGKETIIIKSERGVRIKVSYKNFENIQKIYLDQVIAV